MPCIKECLQNDEFDIQKEIIWIFCNILDSGTDQQKNYIFDMNVFDSLTALLTYCQDDLMLTLLTCLNQLLVYDAEFNSRKLASSLKRNSYNEGMFK